MSVAVFLLILDASTGHFCTLSEMRDVSQTSWSVAHLNQPTGLVMQACADSAVPTPRAGRQLEQSLSSASCKEGLTFLAPSLFAVTDVPDANNMRLVEQMWLSEPRGKTPPGIFQTKIYLISSCAPEILSLGVGWRADPEAIYKLFDFKNYVIKTRRKYSITLFGTAFTYVRI
jgi:hypothetical protein